MEFNGNGCSVFGKTGRKCLGPNYGPHLLTWPVCHPLAPAVHTVRNQSVGIRGRASFLKSKALTATFYSSISFLLFYHHSLSLFLDFCLLPLSLSPISLLPLIIFPIPSFMASSKVDPARGNSHRLSDSRKKVRIVGKIRGFLESEVKSSDGFSPPWISVQKSAGESPDCVKLLCKDQTSRYSQK